MNTSFTPRRRAVLESALACGAALGIPQTLRAQQWPAKPIRLVIGFAAGGPTDVMTRVIAASLAETLGQPVVVDNKPGASGNIGTADVVKSPPDGYTLLVAPTSMETANPILFKASFDPTRDLVPVASFARTDLYLIARPDIKAQDAKALVALAKANPGKLSYASAGAGTPPHLVAELFNQQAGVFVTHIPYRGVAPALQDVMAGQCDYMFDPGASFPHIRTGKVKLLGVAGRKRSAFFPDIPTLTEQGIKGVELDITFGIWAPRGTPADLMARFNAALTKALGQSAVRQRLADSGAEIVNPDIHAFKRFLASESALLSRLIVDRKIKVD